RRIFEDRSRIRNAARLTRCALGLQLRDPSHQTLAIAASKFEIDARDYEMTWQFGAPVRKFHLVLGQRERLAGLGDAMHQRDHLGDLAAERTCVHHQSAPDRPWNAFAEFEPLKTLIDYRQDQRPERGASARNDFRAVNFYFREAVAEPHHQSAHPAIAHEQIRSRAEAETRHARAISRGLRMH